MQGTTSVAPAARRSRRVAGPIGTALATVVALVGGLLAAAPAQAASVITPPEGYRIEGDFRVGETVSLPSEGWQPADVVLDVQWYADDVVVGGSGWDDTPLDLDIEPSMLGKTISAQVTATADDSDPASLLLTAPNPVEAGTWELPTPTFSGPVAAGKQLLVDLPDDVPDDAELSYQWLVDGAVSGSPRDTRLYTPTDAQIGHTLSVIVTARLDGYAAASARSDGVVVIDLPAFPSQPKPLVPTTVYAERQLVATVGTWPTGTKLAYEAYVDGQLYVGDATLTGLMIGADTVGHSYQLMVVASSPAYRDARVLSDARIVKGLFTVPAKPGITGSVRVGSKLTAVPGAWSPTPSFTFAWKISGKTVSTASTFTPSSSYRGKKVAVTVTGTRANYATVTQTSSAVTIGTGVFSAAPAPKVSGSAKVGSTLKASPGTWSPGATLRYQWLRNGAAIKGAAKSSYRLTSSDWAKKVSVRVTASRTGYATQSRTSAATAVVVKPFAKAPAPKITGTVRIGSTLTAKVSGWSPTASYSYQWKRSGAAIAGATKSTYRLTTTDYGKTITVTVTGKKSNYIARAVTSAATAKVAGPPAALSKNGTFRVGSQIRPGTYVASSKGGCYWERRSTAGTSLSGVIANDFVAYSGRVIVTISSGDAYFRTSDCGSWTPLVALGTPASTAKDGAYAVGIHLRPGTYSTNAPAYCYWEVTTDFSGEGTWIENDFLVDPGRATVTVPAGAGFTTDGCGTWTRTGD